MSKRMERATEVARLLLARKLGAPHWGRLFGTVVEQEAGRLCRQWTEQERVRKERANGTG